MKNIPAFPVFPESGACHAAAHQGMTLRDYFAAKAMNVELSRVRSCDFQGDWAGKIAVKSYILADAMLKEREA